MRDTQPSCPSADIWFSTANGSVSAVSNSNEVYGTIFSAYVGIKFYWPGGRGDWELARLVEEIGRG